MSTRTSVCSRIEPELVAAAVGEADATTARHVREHTDRCAPCRDAFQEYQEIDGMVGALREAPVSPGSMAASREKLEARLLDLKSRLVAYRVFPSPVGEVLIARSEQGVVLVEYLERGADIRASRLSRLHGVDAVEDGAEIEALYRDFRAYLEGRTTRLAWPLDLRLARSDFHRAVLAATAAIPYGAVESYKGLARNIGRPEAVRAVAQALRWNPLPVVIPCHRVIGTSGALTGYAGGETTRKRTLLAVEGVPMTPAAHDFQVRRDRMYVLAPGDSEYCLPTCPSVDPFPAGGLLFGSRAHAQEAGLHPCSTCRPDLHPLAR